MSFTPERLAAELRAYEQGPMWADHAEVPNILLKIAADAIERNAAAQDIVHAACRFIAADINVHPCMTREEAVSSGYDKLEDAVNRWTAAQPAQCTSSLKPPESAA